MTVFFVNQFALRPVDKGSLRHFFLAKFLADKDLDVEVVTSDVHYSSREKLIWLSNVEVHDGVRYRVVRGFRYRGQLGRLFNHLQCAVKIFAYLLLRVKKDDVVLGSSPQPFLAYAAYLASRIKGARFIYEVRDLWPQTLIDIGGLSRAHPLVRIMFSIEGTLASKSEKVIALMPLAGNYFTSVHGISENKVIWIGQGIDSSEQIGERSSASSQAEGCEIIYAGSLGAANRIEFLLEIASELQGMSVPVRFSLYGDGPERAGLEQMARKMGLDNIRFLGARSRQEVIQKVAQADFAVALAHNSPLYKFGISFNKLFDYFLARTPVIFIGDVARNPVTDANAGLVIPAGSASEVALAIRAFIAQDPSDIRRLGENGLAFLKQYHDHKVTGQKLLDIVRL